MDKNVERVNEIKERIVSMRKKRDKIIKSFQEEKRTLTKMTKEMNKAIMDLAKQEIADNNKILREEKRPLNNKIENVKEQFRLKIDKLKEEKKTYDEIVKPSKVKKTKRQELEELNERVEKLQFVKNQIMADKLSVNTKVVVNYKKEQVVAVVKRIALSKGKIVLSHSVFSTNNHLKTVGFEDILRVA